jgi:hypothetical protein
MWRQGDDVASLGGDHGVTVSRRTSLRHSVTSIFAVVLLAAAGSAAVARGPGREAAASSANGCAETYVPNQTCYIPDLVALRGTQSYDNAGTHRVCAAAYTSSLTLYASYECGTAYAEHCYGGTNNLYALIGSGDAHTYSGYGTATWAAACP